MVSVTCVQTKTINTKIIGETVGAMLMYMAFARKITHNMSYISFASEINKVHKPSCTVFSFIYIDCVCSFKLQKKTAIKSIQFV